MNVADGPFIFRINDNGGGPNLLLQVCQERGWREYNDNGLFKDNWNLWWRTNGFPASHYRQLKKWQFTNHIPKGSAICRKDNLTRCLKCMKKVFGTIFAFSPAAYNLPLDYTKLVSEYSRQKNGEQSEDVWICKPVGLSQGRGITLFKKLSELVYDSHAVVQKYIKNPLLIGGYKFDLRLYVCVPSFHPLTVYIYREGLARFATEKFSLAHLDNLFAHLTNCSLNKLGPGYCETKDRVGHGCKWNLKQLRHYFHQAFIPDWLIWQRISALIVLTIVSQINGVPSTNNCFEFYGFDILLDSNLNPWLLEVNLSPALGNDCDVDPAVKKPMLHDLFDLLGLPVCNTGLSLFTLWSEDAIRRESLKTWKSVDDEEPCNQTDDESYASTEPQVHSARDDPRPRTAVNVVTVAKKWRKRQQCKEKHRTVKKNCSGVNSVGVCQKDINDNEMDKPTPPRTSPNPANIANDREAGQTRKTRLKTRQIRTKANLPAITVGEDYPDSTTSRATCSEDNVRVQPRRTFNYGQKKGSMSDLWVWGNGRDWSCPKAKEGDWVRAYPHSPRDARRPDLRDTNAGSLFFNDREIRPVVTAVGRYLKVAKEVFAKNQHMSDEVLNNMLLNNLGIHGDVWLPPS
nr:PREDICTED: probable tubulin polyglutamylase TTLL2 [Bemisia tabaci]